MTTVAPNPAPRTVTIDRKMNRYGTLTVHVAEENETRHIVEYTSDDLEETLRELPKGASVPLVTEPIGTRGNAWRALSFGR
ncbi:hypothetical protein SAMN04487949_1820 [Halogranum gelatinilyticum]|uniref:DUF7999 domain-containing protein n=1 Tax=Halogranum gelatinilyticum TaxID=660521 RepID=A0A1G9TL19_9EURY|nr:hypothetical protein [Halogranum gelatinilyticum]SDM48519.1 hypothetical protein SAMN04487949_1820 [Halogranum gelatinilyticum]